MKCHSTGCLDWALTTGLYVFFSTMCVYYRNQMANNNTLKSVMYSFWLNLTAQKQHCGSSLHCSCNVALKQHIPAALCLAGCRYASGTKIDFPPFLLSAVLCPALGAEVPLWLKVVLTARPPSGKAKSEETKQTLFLTHHLIARQLFYAPKLAKWPWWGKYQLSIIDYQDFLHFT